MGAQTNWRVVCCPLEEKAAGSSGGKRLEQFLAVRYGIFHKVGSRVSPSCALDLGKAIRARIPYAQLRHLFIAFLYYPDAMQQMASLVLYNSNHHRKKRRVCGLATILVVLALQGSSLAHEKKSSKTERKPAAQLAATAEAHYELGVSYHEQMFADLDQAIAEYEQAIKLRSDFAEAHYHLGLSYHTKAKLAGDDKVLYRKALKEYKLYLTQLPNGPLAEKAKQNIKAIQPRLR